MRTNPFMIALACAATSACAARTTYVRPDYDAHPRYHADPDRVTEDESGTPTVHGQPLQRPWRMVATFHEGIDSLAGAARLFGCDAYWRAAHTSSYQIGNYVYTHSEWHNGVIDGVPFGPGDQGCIEYTDGEAQTQRANESTWQWTAYQRPPLSAGITFNGALEFNYQAPNSGRVLGGWNVSIEKYFRNVPLGFGVRIRGTDGNSTAMNPVTYGYGGLLVLVPAISFWKVQLTAVAGAEFGGTFANGSDLSIRIGGGSYFDLVASRLFMIGIGAEYWLDVSGVGPSAFTPMMRIGMPF